MTSIYENLSWLPAAPPDFSATLKISSTGKELRVLSKYSLNDNQLAQLSKKLKYLQDSQADLAGLIPVSLGIVSNATTKLIVPSLIGTALRFGIALKVVEAEFNQVAQEAFSTNSTFTEHQLNAILVSIDYRGLPFDPSPGNRISANKNVQHCFSYIKSVIKSLKIKTGSQIILQNIAPPVEHISGSYEGLLEGTLSWLISRLNRRLMGLIADDTLMVDISGLASNLGLENWHDPTLWHLAKLPFAQKYTPIYAEYVCRILAAKLGKSRRCLILDLDNTLWGGVIGDDGLCGILIGNGDPTAEAHLHLQQVVLELRKRGVILAVSSKNEETIALEPFKVHQDMLLREEHFASFQINWKDKASNIKVIAQSLSLGLESMVFLDDNPAERLQVRNELHEVAVPELPKDPALFARTLIAAGYFESLSFSDEDLKRASFYQDNAKRGKSFIQSSDTSSYLKSLEMEIYSTPFDALGRQRIVQLINKSNQFNLTTKRYSETEIKDLEGNSNFFTRQIRLNDIFGDNGMISIVIGEKAGAVLKIDAWLMSCRVLGRCVEVAVLSEIVNYAKNNGVTKLVGIYKASDRNIIVKDHYKKLNFTKKNEANGTQEWEMDITNYRHIRFPLKFNNVI